MKLFVGILVLARGAGALGAQTATAPSQPESEQRSPCSFEAIFPIGDPSVWRKANSLEGFKPGKSTNLAAWPAKVGTEISIPEWYALGLHTCDGVSLREEAKSGGRWDEPGLRISELRTVPSGYEVTLEATLYNPKTSRDKLVTIDAQVLGDDNAVIASGNRTQKTPANAKSGNNADIVFLLSKDDMRKTAKVRLTLTARDD